MSPARAIRASSTIASRRLVASRSPHLSTPCQLGLQRQLQQSLSTSLKMQQAEQQRQVWADSPFSLITSTGVKARPEIPQDHYAREFARSMAGIHNVLLRALNASYNQCLSVSPGDEARDFFIFNQAFYTMLQSHHDMEEESLFPAIGKVSGNPDVMAVNVREHADFEKELLQFKNYIFETDPKVYDGPQIKSLIDRLGPLLQKHLHNEISTLLDLHVVGSAALKGVFSNAERGTSGGMHDLFKYAAVI